ncbi:helix-turn-helix domain-containing protein [Pectinatus frisingensis]|uniref:helix-turn-helix domain-containing protein n=1 Tax=Pectinatus frisingensis TaxID=865 RepID=UPI0015F5A3AD|nr:helix-turn-helix transcriptional regulator [Pectinatus frisingensis]
MLSKILKKERNRKGLSQATLSTILGVSQQTIGSWEVGRTSPDPEMLKKIATFFDISTDYLLGNENNSLPELNKKDEKDIAKELEKMMSDLDSDSGLSFYGEPLDNDNKEILRTSLENTLRLSKQLAKKKFTPKKYRKDE